MAFIRKKLVYAAVQEAFSETDKNPNLNYDLTLTNQQKLLNGIIFADNSLTKDGKVETARIITESYDFFKIIKNEGERRICENCLCECLATFYCEICIRNYLKAYFSNWTSGNNDVDDLIRNCQMESVTPTRIIEWISYNNFQNIKYLTEGGCSQIYTAKWTDGPYDKWDSKKQELKRFGMLKVVLKSLENIESANRSWFDEPKSHLIISNKSLGVVKCFGLSRDPSNGNYMLVLQRMDGDLRSYLQQNHNKLTWKIRINIICDIIKALYEIHKEKAIHGDLHSGNILYLQSTNLWCISDLGFCRPADKSFNSIYGNLPYIAPEVMAEIKQSFASDIYSIGMLMWEISSGKRPFINCDHGYNLAINIINGMRPKIVPGTPLEYKQLMEQCWDAYPLKRPDTDCLYNKIFEIRNLYYQNGSNKSCDQPFHKYNINLYQFFQSNKSKSFKTDYGSRSITSKFYNFEHLSSLKPKNATEEEQRAFHSKPYVFNLSDSNNSSTLNKVKRCFEDLSVNLTNKFKKLKINSKNDNRNENELLQQETNNNINTNYYNMNSNSINLSETKVEEDISAYSSSEYSSSTFNSREFSFKIPDDIGNISSKDLTDSSRTNRITTEENDYVDITNSEDQDEFEILDEKF